jgi:aminopeptidase N
MRYLYILLFSTTLFSQQISRVDFKSVLGKISINPDKKEVSGTVLYDFEVLKMVDTIYIDGQNMTFEHVFVNGKEVEYKNSGKKLAFFQNYKIGKNNISFDYIANPKQTIYFNNFNDNWQIWTQGQGKYTSNWFPSFDDVNEKLIFNLDITFDKKYEVISNGVLVNINDNYNQNDNLKKWQYRMQKPMSSYLLMLAIGKYENKIVKSKSGILIQLFIEPEDKLKFEPTYRYSKELFDFFESEIGVKYPWQIYKQIPVRDFLYAGMENTSATVFAREFVVDSISFNDRNYIEVNAHELAHQWFGDLVTAKSGKHHWLQEGFATYYSLLAQKKILGVDYFYQTLFDIANEIKSDKGDKIPILNEKASSLSFYKKGAMALFDLENQIGEKNFRKAVKNYLNKYKFKNVETDDFLNEVKSITKFDSEKFKKDWLENPDFDYDKINSLLSKNKSVLELNRITNLRKTDFDTKKTEFESLLKSNSNENIKQEVIYQLFDVPFEAKKQLLKIAMASNNLKVRQTIAATMQAIPDDFLSDYQSLLSDQSFITKEIVLNNLIKNHPEKTNEYLESTKKISLNDTNFRIFWLSKAIKNSIFEPENQLRFRSELFEYANSKYESSVRQIAISSLLNFDAENPMVLQHLVNATTHYKWQFSGFAKTKIRNFIKEQKYRLLFQELLPKLSEKENVILTKLLNEK